MMNVKVKVYDDVKYNPESKKVSEVEYSNIQSIEVKVIEDGDLYRYGFNDYDEYKEYCFLTFADGEVSTFRNSHVDIFRI